MNKFTRLAVPMLLIIILNISFNNTAFAFGKNTPAKPVEKKVTMTNGSYDGSFQKADEVKATKPSTKKPTAKKIVKPKPVPPIDILSESKRMLKNGIGEEGTSTYKVRVNTSTGDTKEEVVKTLHYVWRIYGPNNYGRLEKEWSSKKENETYKFKTVGKYKIVSTPYVEWVKAQYIKHETSYSYKNSDGSTTSGVTTWYERKVVGGPYEDEWTDWDRTYLLDITTQQLWIETSLTKPVEKPSIDSEPVLIE